MRVHLRRSPIRACMAPAVVGDFAAGDIVSATQDLRRIMDGVDLLV